MSPEERSEERNRAKENFLSPRSRYRGEFSPQTLTFNANLQEFAQQVSIICNLETGGKIPSDDAYKRIKALWKALKRSKKELLDQPLPDVELPPEETP